MQGDDDRAWRGRIPRQTVPHGAKAAEVYGIVGYLLSTVSFSAIPMLSAAGPLHNSSIRMSPRLEPRAATFCGNCEVPHRGVFAVLWLLWAFTPDWVLQMLSVTYYPDK